MKAVAIKAHGGVDQIGVVEVPAPVADPNDVIIRVKAAALNRLDLFTMGGIQGLTLQMPHVVGSDASGIVDSIGAHVKDVAVGDRVTFNPGIYCSKCERCLAGEESECINYMILGEHLPGSMAEFVKVPAKNVYKIPGTLPFEDAAAASLVYQTAYRMVVSKAGVKPGDIAVVLGAGSGLSTATIQIASLAGARVIATTSDDEKIHRAKAIGATDVINYKKENWSKRVWELTGKRGADFIMDAIGKETLNHSVRALRKGGIITIPGGTSGQIVDLDLRYVYWKQVKLIGSTMGNVQEFHRAMDLVAERKLKPVVGGIFTPETARSAFDTLEKGGHFGKLVVRFSA